MVSKVRGRFTDVKATITIGEDPLDSSVVAEIGVASITTGDEKRDEHLRGADFFDVERYPTITFRSTGVRTARGGDYVLEGDLTVRDVTRRVELSLEYLGEVRDPWGGTRAAFAAETEVSRKEWGLEWNVALDTGGVLVGDKVKLHLDVEAVLAS
jgi:polyisoprenoid-binding protein YceI